MAGIASLVLGLFSFTLPATPPKKSTGEKVNHIATIRIRCFSLVKGQKLPGFLYRFHINLYPTGFLLSKR
jgi:hypothetical protein